VSRQGMALFHAIHLTRRFAWVVMGTFVQPRHVTKELG
jgi:hypothetical protein